MFVHRLASSYLALASLFACGGHGEAAAVDPAPVTRERDSGLLATPPAPAPAPVVAVAAGEPSTDELGAVPPDEPPRVVVVPLGEFPSDLLTAVEEALVAEYGARVELAEPVTLPKAAYYPPRKRYRADLLIDDLHRYDGDRGDEVKVLGLTEVDISTSKGKFVDWGVFGLGELGGSTCVVSIHRLKRKARDREHLRFRTVSTAIHEVGHTFGLEHCSEQRCVMQDAEGSIANTDGGTGHLAAGCRAKFDDRPAASAGPPR